MVFFFVRKRYFLVYFLLYVKELNCFFKLNKYLSNLNDIYFEEYLYMQRISVFYENFYFIFCFVFRY